MILQDREIYSLATIAKQIFERFFVPGKIREKKYSPALSHLIQNSLNSHLTKCRVDQSQSLAICSNSLILRYKKTGSELTASWP